MDLTAQDIFALIPAAEIRAVREESPSNLATLCYKVQYHPFSIFSFYIAKQNQRVFISIEQICLLQKTEILNTSNTNDIFRKPSSSEQLRW